MTDLLFRAAQLPSKAGAPVSDPAPFRKHKSPGRRPALQRGVALVITLIFLSVITVVVVTFLALSGRERAEVMQTARSTDAEFAATAALERVKAILGAQILAANNPNIPDMLVSVNATNTATTISIPRTNANFFESDVAALKFDARAPVFVNTNRAGQSGPLDYRFYLDLNRNHQFETNGWFQGWDASGLVGTNRWFIGDPEWIGILKDPTRPHSRDNPFIARYAYLVLPVGKGLDLNYIHNLTLAQSADLTMAPLGKEYFRYQGFGGWENNLATFLMDLNPNVWRDARFNDPNPKKQPFYSYLQGDTGIAFSDARDLLRYRYAHSLNTLASVDDLVARNIFGLNATNDFRYDLIAGYGGDPTIVLNPSATPWVDPLGEFDNTARPWPGADNARNFYHPSDYFDPAKVTNTFITRLNQASTGPSSLDRYTFYEMLAQIGTDSASETPRVPLRRVQALTTQGSDLLATIPAHGYFSGDIVTVTSDSAADGKRSYRISVTGSNTFTLRYAAATKPTGGNVTMANPYANAKIDLNYDNFYVVPNDFYRSRAQFTNWIAEDFFTAVADRMLRKHGAFLANLPVYATNVHITYNPAVHRCLQVAANIYDATRTDPFPTIFRPIFSGPLSNQTITGYAAFTNFNTPADIDKFVNNFVDENPLGIPIIVGAKKGLPNFNQFTMRTASQSVRKLEFHRRNQTSKAYEGVQQHILAITNYFGVEAWNAYTNTPLLTDLRLRTTVDSMAVITNQTGQPIWGTNDFRSVLSYTNVFHWTNGAARFQVRTNDSIFLEDSLFTGTSPYLTSLRTAPRPFPYAPTNSQLNWGLRMNNRLVYVLSKKMPDGTQRVLDLVYLANLNSGFNFTNDVRRSKEPIPDFWGSEGMANQVLISTGGVSTAGISLPGGDWKNYGTENLNGFLSRDLAQKKFHEFLFTTNLSTTLSQQAPFTPVAKLYQSFNWEPNDPLVHYRTDDLVEPPYDEWTNHLAELAKLTNPTPPGQPYIINLGKQSTRYQPWDYVNLPGRAIGSSSTTDDLNLSLKDPMIRSPDDWNFPENKLPNIGWIGRVHRGTPWQTIYLKSAAASIGQWHKQVGNHIDTNGFFVLTHPTNDWQFLDLFTVAPNENAVRGQLSINQSRLPAWSAVFGGVNVLTNTGAPSPSRDGDPFFGSTFVEPGSPQLQRLVDAINAKRESKKGQSRTFTRLSELLEVPELTDQSPFLDPSQVNGQFGLRDEVIERIPQQIMSLLKVGDARYVIYAYGQSLTPAPNSIVTSGANFGMCTNYAITGEVATRAVVQMDLDYEFDNVTGNRTRVLAHPKVKSFNLLPPD